MEAGDGGYTRHGQLLGGGLAAFYNNDPRRTEDQFVWIGEPSHGGAPPQGVAAVYG